MVGCGCGLAWMSFIPVGALAAIVPPPLEPRRGVYVAMKTGERNGIAAVEVGREGFDQPFGAVVRLIARRGPTRRIQRHMGQTRPAQRHGS
jgi:hypothetical protein